jgi:ABC-2 type transport system permease protein
MNSLYAGTLNEVQKIFMRKKATVFLVISALIPVGSVISFVFFQNKLGIFAVNSASFPVLILSIFSSLLLPLFIFSLVADLFSGELGDKTLKLTLTRPITRFKVFLSKNLAVGIFILIDMALIFIVSAVSGFFLDISSQAVTGFFQALLAYVTELVPMIFLSIMAGFLSQFFRNSGAALTTSIFVFWASKVIPFFSLTLARILPFAYTDWYTMWLGTSVGAGRLINVFFIFVSYSVILFAAGFYLFDKKEM